MKLLSALFICFFVHTTFFSQTTQPKQSNGKQEIYFDEELELTVVPCNGAPEVLYSSKPKKSVEEIAKRGRFHYLINGSYFSGSRLSAKPAGWFRLYGRKFSKLSKSRQLTHVVRIDSTERQVHFIPISRFRTNPQSICEFQSGPLVTADGEIQTELIERSLNGKGNYSRTLLARTVTNKLYFITFRHPISLTDAAAVLLELPMFKKLKPTIINLDGGASVSFYSREYPEYNFNTEDTLPLLIGVR
ncbi:MAG: phosphodiester glycosidase family protein [Ignavibacteriales bacterium]|nr:phosphodiester glycosidase family protein [Ignavibacteriales bacterium]